MPKFNNFKAFTGGVAEGLNNANALRDKERMELDMAKQKEMLSYDHEKAILQAKQDSETSVMNNNAAIMAAAGKNTAVQATTNALGAAQTPPTPVSDVTTPTTPTTPPVAPAQPAQASGSPAVGSMSNGQPPQTPSAPTPTQGGLSSPQNSPVPVSGLQSQQTPSQAPAPAPLTNPSPSGAQDQLVSPKDSIPVPNSDPRQEFMDNAALSNAYGVIAHKEMYGEKAPMTATSFSMAKELGYQKYVQDQLKKEELSNKIADKAPLDISDKSIDIGDNDKLAITAAKREGLINPNATTLNKVPTSLLKDVDKQQDAFTGQETASKQGIANMAGIVQNISKIPPGPGAAPMAYLESAWGQISGTQRSSALAAFQENAKAQIAVMNAQYQTLKGGRLSHVTLQLEKQGIPDASKMSPEASFAVVQQFMNNYKSLIGYSQAYKSLPDGYATDTKRLQYADKWAEQNPAILPTGQPNPDFKMPDQWAKEGSKGITQSGVIGGLENDIKGGAKDVASGGKGVLPSQKAPQDRPPLGSFGQ